MGALFRFLSGVTEVFCKIESKLLNSRVLAGGSVMGCAKKVLVLSIYKKSSKVCSITKCLRSQTKVWKLATLLMVLVTLITVIFINCAAYKIFHFEIRMCFFHNKTLLFRYHYFLLIASDRKFKAKVM